MFVGMVNYIFRAHQYLKRLIMSLFAANCPLLSMRMFLYRIAGLKIGQNTRINPKCYFSSVNIQLVAIHLLIAFVKHTMA